MITQANRVFFYSILMFVGLATSSLSQSVGATEPNVAGYNSWELISRLDDQNHFTSISFVEHGFGWAVGDSGKIVHTDDGGVTWTLQGSPVSSRLVSVYFTDKYFGTAVGSDDTILRTSDGGITWTVQMVGAYLDHGTFFSTFFIDQNTGWVVGNDARILYTVDGGETWSKGDVQTRWTVTAVHFLDAIEGWAVATNRVLLHSTDGGKTWAKTSLENIQYGGTVVFDDVFFSSNLRGWIGVNGIADSGIGFFDLGVPIVGSLDGGTSWNCEIPPSEGHGPCRFGFADEDIGWMIHSHSILVTLDSGDTWSRQHYSEGSGLFVALSVVDASHAWALTTSGDVYKLK